MQITAVLTALLLLNPSVLSGAGDSAPIDDRLVFDALKELNNRGADLNNAGDPIGCYRFYQGGMLTLRTLATHRPSFQKAIDDGFKAADRRPLHERAFALHTTITELRAMIKPAGHVPPSTTTPVPSGELPKPTPVQPNTPPTSFPSP